MYRVRRHLANGPYKGMWQVKGNDEVKYYPQGTVLIMFGCELRNRRSTAKKIYNGETNKTVCAWVDCSSYIAVEDLTNHGWTSLDENIYYDFNPRVDPYWVNSYNENCDGTIIDVLVTDYLQLVDGTGLDTAGLPLLIEDKL